MMPTSLTVPGIVPVLLATAAFAGARGLLPGAMRRNQNLRFQCRDVYLKVERNDLPFTRNFEVGQVLRIEVRNFELGAALRRHSVAGLAGNVPAVADRVAAVRFRLS